MKKEKEISNNELGRMISVGFAGVDKRFDAIEERFDKRFDAIDARFDKIEKVVLADHRRRIEQLEADMKILKSALAV